MKTIVKKSGRFRWPVVLWICVLSFSAGWGALHATAGEQSRPKPGNAALGPVAEIPGATHDLGAIKSKGIAYHHDFLILNTGSEELEIREVVVG